MTVGANIIDKFVNIFVPPSPLEGFSSVTVVRNDEEVNAALEHFKLKQPNSEAATTVGNGNDDNWEAVGSKKSKRSR
jgi:hypothetical protein